jgi:hypothetical protein
MPLLDALLGEKQNVTIDTTEILLMRAGNTRSSTRRVTRSS